MTKFYSEKWYIIPLSHSIDWIGTSFYFVVILSIFTGFSKVFRGLCNLFLYDIYTGQEFRDAIHMPQLQAAVFKWDSAWWFTLFLPTIAYHLAKLMWHFSRMLALSPVQRLRSEQSREWMKVNDKDLRKLERIAIRLVIKQSPSQIDDSPAHDHA